MKRFELIDFLKGYSILTIMLFHYLQFLHLPAPFDKMILFGGTGIHLFILLSGLGLFYSYYKKPLSYPMFLKRRLTRVYVPYIFIVLISAFISLFLPVFENSLYALGGHVFFYKMFDNSIIGSYGYQLWFISMILQFYVTFHLIVWLKNKLNNNLFMVVSILISIAWASIVAYLGKEDMRNWNSFFLEYFWEFALGMVIADKIASGQQLIGQSAKNIVLLAVGVVNCAIFAVIALKGGDSGKLFNDYFALAGYSLLAIFIYKLNIKLINQFFLYVGNISLSVYLLHFLVLLTFRAILGDTSHEIIVLASIVAVFPLSAVYQKLVNAFFKWSKL